MSDSSLRRRYRDALAEDYGMDVSRSADYKEGYDAAVRRYVRSPADAERVPPPVAGMILCSIVAGVVGFVLGLATSWGWG